MRQALALMNCWLENFAKWDRILKENSLNLESPNYDRSSNRTENGHCSIQDELVYVRYWEYCMIQLLNYAL